MSKVERRASAVPNRPSTSDLRPSVLIVSNGRGEDAVGALLARALGDRLRVTAYPLVGIGDAYGSVPLLDPRRSLPSGGFALRGDARSLTGDLRAGLARLSARQRGTLKAQRGRHDAVVAIGDVYCLWMAARAGSPVVFVATAKSEYNERHRLPEVWLMRRHSAVIFTRDQPTADALARRGLPARYAGNPLMDAIPTPAAPLPLPPGAPIVLLLPGSRADAVHNLRQLLKVCARVNAPVAARFVCAIPPTVPMAEIASQAIKSGWEVAGSYLQSGQAAVLLTRDFGSALHSAAIAVGLAGTANEQAAGTGIPVVGFPVPGAVQFTPKFLSLQQHLLGEALMAVRDWESAADAVVRLLRDPTERARRAEVGRNRMGSPGAIEAIAAEVLART